MSGHRKTYAWYVRNGMKPPAHLKPKTTGYERKTYAWYIRNGMEPPAHVKRPNKIADVFKGAYTPPIIPSAAALPVPVLPSLVTEETEPEIEARLKKRFGVLGTLTRAVLEGEIKTLIVSGPAGVGKSYTVEEELNKFDPTGKSWQINKGNARATGLFKMFWEFRHPGSVIVFDDCDAIFGDEIALNLLKGACDTSRRRRVAWLTEAILVAEDGQPIPKSFDFEGSIIFITNYDFDHLISKGHKLAPHLAALVSRSHYLDLMFKSKKDAVVRIKQVVRETDMLKGLTFDAKCDVLRFVEDRAETLRELSLRTVLKIAAFRRMDEATWKDMAETECKQR